MPPAPHTDTGSRMGLAIAWLRDETGREGEVALFDEAEGERSGQ